MAAVLAPGYGPPIGARKDQQTKVGSRLAEVRVAKGIYRRELARAVGISYSTLRRLERQELPNAPLWWYRNCAIALGVELDDVIDDRERGWRKTRRLPEPPEPEWPYRGEGQITWR